MYYNWETETYVYLIQMTFDLAVTISMHFYERCQTNRDAWNFKKNGGGTLIFSYIGWPGLFFGFKILNFNIFGGIQKAEYFMGFEDFVDIFWDHHKIGLYLEVISMNFRVFSEGQGTDWRKFFGLL